MLFWNDTKLSNLVVIEFSVDHLQKDFWNCLESIKKKKSSIKSSRICIYFCRRRIIMHEKIASKNKQSIELIESRSFNAEQEFSKTKNTRRISIIFIEIFDDASENAKISYYIRNMNQLRYWLKKNENALIKAWINIRDESIFVMNEYNKKIVKFEEFIIDYNNCINEFNDDKLIIRELKMKLQKKNLKNSNTFLFIIEDDVIVFTFKKLLDSFVLIDDKDFIIDDWLSIMRNKMKDNANWFSTNVQQKAYVRIKIDDDAMKHLIFRFFKNSIKSYTIANKIFDDLYQIFDDSNRRINALKAYRRLKQIESFKDFNIFWAEFQRLTNDFELYNQKAFLEDLKNKMSYDLQKILVIESYKVMDLHEFAKMCRYTDQTLRNVNNKFKNIREDFVNDAEREESIVIVNSNQNNDWSISRSRFEISEFESESNFRAITQSSSENQVNFINCYNCEKSDHYSRNCRQFRKMNLNSFVREMNVHDKNDSSSENFEIESKKE